MILRIFMIVAFSVLSIFLLNKTATFHTIRLFQRSDPNDPFVGTIEIQPAHVPTSVRVTLSTSQTDDIRIVDKAPGSWNDQDNVDWGMQDDTPFGVTIFLKDFKSPQVFGCWFRLSQSADKLEVEAAPEQAEIHVLREGELHRYRRNIEIFGGVLCILALFVWCYRSCWFRSTV